MNRPIPADHTFATPHLAVRGGVEAIAFLRNEVEGGMKLTAFNITAASAARTRWYNSFRRLFERFDYVVAPSGSCAGMLKVHYPRLLADDPRFAERAKTLAAKSYELTSFLVDVLGFTELDATYEGTATYHDSCSSLRELHIKDAPRRLLANVPGLTLVELPESEVCCGFGGTFSVKYPDISGAILDTKLNNILDTEANTVLAADLGCLMQIAGGLSRQRAKIEVRHVAEVLAGMTDTPAIAASKSG